MEGGGGRIRPAWFNAINELRRKKHKIIEQKQHNVSLANRVASFGYFLKFKTKRRIN